MEKIFPKSWGCYPPEYNKEIHGFYDPSRYYGKPDTPFTKVKLGELGAWIGRRNKSPRAMIQAMSRGIWRYHFKWVNVKKPGPAFLLQSALLLSGIFFLIDYGHYKSERRYRYH